MGGCTWHARCTWKVTYRVLIWKTGGKRPLSKYRFRWKDNITMDLKEISWKCTWAATPYSVQRLATGWTVRGSKTGGGEVFRTRLDWPWCPPSPLYNGYRISFPVISRSGGGVKHPLPSTAEVKEGVELYSNPLWAFTACSRVHFAFYGSVWSEFIFSQGTCKYKKRTLHNGSGNPCSINCGHFLN